MSASLSRRSRRCLRRSTRERLALPSVAAVSIHGSTSVTRLTSRALVHHTSTHAGQPERKRQHPKEAAANRGCLSARQWSDIRQAMRLTRSEGGVLILHGVKVLPSDDAASESLLRGLWMSNSTCL